jgi:hypothetical protein
LCDGFEDSQLKCRQIAQCGAEAFDLLREDTVLGGVESGSVNHAPGFTRLPQGGAKLLNVARDLQLENGVPYFLRYLPFACLEFGI